MSSFTTVRFDARLNVTIIGQFNGLIDITTGNPVVVREIYGKVTRNDAAYPEDRIVYVTNELGENYTAELGLTQLVDGETWYRVIALGTEDTQLVANAHFTLVDGSGDFIDWSNTFPAGTTSQIIEEFLEIGVVRTIAHVDTSTHGTAPPTLQFYQDYTVGTELQANTLYTAIVWCRAGVSSQGRISVINDGTPISGTTNATEEFRKLSVEFTTGAVSESVQLRLELVLGDTCDFMLANIIEGNLIGFDEGESLQLAVQGDIPSLFNIAEDLNGDSISFPFAAGSGYHDTGITRVDLYFDTPSTAVNIPGGTFDIRPTIELSVISDPDEDVTIWYSVSGNPLVAYSVPFVFDQDGTNSLRWFGVDSQGNTEDEHIETYVINAPQVRTTPTSGSYGSEQTIAFDTKGRDGSIFYEFEGIIPGFHSPVFDPGNPIVITTGTTILKYFFQDEFGTSTSVQTDTYTIDTTRPIIEQFTINGGASVTNVPTVTLELQLQGDIAISNVQFSVADSNYTLEELNSGAFEEEVLSIFADAPFLQPREEILFDVLEGAPHEPQVTFITIYGRAFTYDENSVTEFSPIIKASIQLNLKAPFLIVNSIVDRNGDTPGTTSIYNAFTLTGHKTADAQIIAVDEDGGEQILVDNITSNEEWECTLVLSLGTHVVSIVAESELGTRSVPYEFEVTIVVPPGVTDATALASGTGEWSVSFMFFDKGDHVIPYHTFRVNATTSVGLEPTVDSITEQELIGESIITILGTAPSNSIVNVSIDRVR